MRHIDRTDIPDILARNGVEWLHQFDEDYRTGERKRPRSGTYNHPKIKEKLISMSHHKCFYCEGKVKGVSSDVEHSIEINVNHLLAFDWNNLYLSCKDCNNGKKSHNVIPVTDVLDPCRNSDEEIENHIFFDKEQIIPVDDSVKGDLTIRKYNLDSLKNDHKRSKVLISICEEINKIDRRMREENRKEPSDEERRKVRGFMSSYSPYSLMAKIYIHDNFPDYI